MSGSYRKDGAKRFCDGLCLSVLMGLFSAFRELSMQGKHLHTARTWSEASTPRRLARHISDYPFSAACARCVSCRVVLVAEAEPIDRQLLPRNQTLASSTCRRRQPPTPSLKLLRTRLASSSASLKVSPRLMRFAYVFKSISCANTGHNRNFVCRS